MADVASNLSKENAQYSPFEFQPIMRRSTLAIWPTLCRVTAFLAPVSPPVLLLGKNDPLLKFRTLLFLYHFTYKFRKLADMFPHRSLSNRDVRRELTSANQSN